MRYLLILLLLVSACAKKPADQVAAENQKALAAPVAGQEQGPFELFLGIHQIEYFADRMVLKAKLAGYDFAKKTTYEKDGITLHQVILGPFKTKAEAEKAEQAIKARAPDLDISKVRAIK
jgi:cell division septation protein DedD